MRSDADIPIQRTSTIALVCREILNFYRRLRTSSSARQYFPAIILYGTSSRDSIRPYSSGRADPWTWQRHALLLLSGSHHEHIIISIVVNIMRMFQFQLHPLTPVEGYPCAGDTNTEPSSPSSSQSSPEICDFPSKGGNRWQNGRRRRQAPRNIEQRPYHSPNHISPPHDKPMTKNDMYFALDCEVSH